MHVPDICVIIDTTGIICMEYTSMKLNLWAKLIDIVNRRFTGRLYVPFRDERTAMNCVIFLYDICVNIVTTGIICMEYTSMKLYLWAKLIDIVNRRFTGRLYVSFRDERTAMNCVIFLYVQHNNTFCISISICTHCTRVNRKHDNHFRIVSLHSYP